MSSCSELLKQELNNLKSKLEEMELQLEDKSKEINLREEKWGQMEAQVDHIFHTNTEQIIKFNVGGRKFATRHDTLLRVKDTLFYKMAVSNRFDFDGEIFFDRSPKLFDYILDYLRGVKISYDRFTRDELEELSIEADYYELTDISNDLQDRVKEIDYVRFESSGVYNYNNILVGTQLVQDLKDKSLTKGICATSPGWIMIELNGVYDIEEIDIGGYNGNSTAWYAPNGNGAQIQTSIDKSTWTTVGTIPNNFGLTIINVRLTKSSGKYIKFVHNNYLGIGYLKIKKQNK